MGIKKRIGCGCCCVPVILIVAIHVWSICKHRDYEFELRIFNTAPDFNQYSVVYSQKRPGGFVPSFYLAPYGYGLYHEAMRENGIDALILTDGLMRTASMFFEGGPAEPIRIPWEGGVSYFGRLPAMGFSGLSNVVASIQNTMACSNALQAIEKNAILKYRLGVPRLDSDAPYSFEIVDYIGECAGIGTLKYDSSGRGVTSEENAKQCAKEAITACAIKTAFPGLRTPRIDEEYPVMGKRWHWHGRVPILCHLDVVATRKFNFYDENGILFASLRINVEYNNPSGWDLKGHDEIYKAIFKEVFKELKSSKGRCIVRGKSHYDDVGGVGVISGLKRNNEGQEPLNMSH